MINKDLQQIFSKVFGEIRSERVLRLVDLDNAESLEAILEPKEKYKFEEEEKVILKELLENQISTFYIERINKGTIPNCEDHKQGRAYTSIEAAQALGISESGVFNRLRNGPFPDGISDKSGYDLKRLLLRPVHRNFKKGTSFDIRDFSDYFMIDDKITQLAIKLNLIRCNSDGTIQYSEFLDFFDRILPNQVKVSSETDGSRLYSASGKEIFDYSPEGYVIFPDDGELRFYDITLTAELDFIMIKDSDEPSENYLEIRMKIESSDDDIEGLDPEEDKELILLIKEEEGIETLNPTDVFRNYSACLFYTHSGQRGDEDEEYLPEDITQKLSKLGLVIKFGDETLFPEKGIESTIKLYEEYARETEIDARAISKEIQERGIYVPEHVVKKVVGFGVDRIHEKADKLGLSLGTFESRISMNKDGRIVQGKLLLYNLLNAYVVSRLRVEKVE